MDLLICPVCKEQFKTTPVVIPCGWTVCDVHIRNNELTNCALCHGSHLSENATYPINKAFEIHMKALRTNESINQVSEKLTDLKTIQKEPHIYIADFFAKLVERVHVREKEVTDSVHSYFDRMIFEINQIKQRYKELESDPNGQYFKMKNFDLNRLDEELEAYKKDNEARMANLRSQLTFVPDNVATEKNLRETNKRLAEIERTLSEQLSNFLDKEGFILTARSTDIAKCEDFCGKLLVREKVTIEISKTNKKAVKSTKCYQPLELILLAIRFNSS
jgi:hypothetical protein